MYLYVLIWNQNIAHLHIWLKNIVIKRFGFWRRRKNYMIGPEPQNCPTAGYYNFQHSVPCMKFEFFLGQMTSYFFEYETIVWSFRSRFKHCVLSHNNSSVARVLYEWLRATLNSHWRMNECTKNQGYRLIGQVPVIPSMYSGSSQLGSESLVYYLDCQRVNTVGQWFKNSRVCKIIQSILLVS